MRLRYYTLWFCLLGCLAFIACEGEDIAPTTTSSIEKVGMVEMPIGLSVGEGGGADTRMTAENTQSKSSNLVFLGLGYVNLVPFANKAPISSTSQRLKRNNAFLILNNESTSGEYRNQLYTAMLIPSGTKSFLVYARPEGGGEGAEAADKFAHGSLIPFGLDGDATDDNASSITFSPDVIVDDDDSDAYTSALNMANNIATHLTNLVNAKYTKDGKTLYWRDLSGEDRELYNSITHDGYPFSVASGAALKTQLNSIKSTYSTKAGQTTETLLNGLYQKIRDLALTKESLWNTYSGISNLPDGLIVFKWDDSKQQFVALSRANSKQYLNPQIADYSIMAYPSQLWYYANSNIKTATNNDLTEQEINGIFFNLPNNNKKWNDVLANDYFKPVNGGEDVINSQTTVVAIENSLNYGIAKLLSNVKTPLNSVPIPETSPIATTSLQWRGVLLTNQHKVGYDFQVIDDVNGVNDYIVYDSQIKNKDGDWVQLKKNNSLLPKNSGNTDHGIHTLVVPSLDNEKVYMIAELYNNSNNTTIIGHGGCIIPPQSYFYMVGVLDPAEGTVPSGSGASPTKVFQSDRYTKVDAVFNDFEGAYNYVPDLASPALVLGLKINLSWEQTEPKSVWLH